MKPPPRRASYATVVNVGNTKVGIVTISYYAKTDKIQAEGVQSKTDEATAKKPKVGPTQMVSSGKRLTEARLTELITRNLILPSQTKLVRINQRFIYSRVLLT